MSTIQRFEQNITSIETGFNVAGSVPVVGCGSGLIRAYLGKVQLVVGAIFATAGYFGALLTSDPATKAMFAKIMAKGVHHVLHGTANFGRGVAECLLGLTIVGSVALLIIQARSDEGFAPRFKYGQNIRNVPVGA